MDLRLFTRVFRWREGMKFFNGKCEKNTSPSKMAKDDVQDCIRALGAFVGVKREMITPEAVKNKRRAVWILRSLSQDANALEMADELLTMIERGKRPSSHDLADLQKRACGPADPRGWNVNTFPPSDTAASLSSDLTPRGGGSWSSWRTRSTRSSGMAS